MNWVPLDVPDLSTCILIMIPALNLLCPLILAKPNHDSWFRAESLCHVTLTDWHNNKHSGLKKVNNDWHTLNFGSKIAEYSLNGVDSTIWRGSSCFTIRALSLSTREMCRASENLYWSGALRWVTDSRVVMGRRAPSLSGFVSALLSSHRRRYWLLA